VEEAVSTLQSELDKLSTQDEVIEVYLKDELYVARWFTVGYWVYKKRGKFNDPVYFVTPYGCTCGGYKALGLCKHYSGLRDRFK
jgi:hypothetical protein